MSYRQLEIHEFSTGIKIVGTIDNWVSGGFTGGYINSTGEIPHAVERAIANKWFEVSPNPDINDPAIIGFVVDEWAVVAVVILAKDDKSRSFSAYRYFWAEGKEESLSKIVAWLDDEIIKGRMPVFNPFENRTNPIISEVSPKVSISELIEANYVTPFVHNPNSDNLLANIDCIARKKAKISGQNASWAYNVRALERPELFQVILPTNNEALELIKKTIASRPKQDFSIAIDEQALKTAIKGLVDRATIKPEQWLIFMQNIDLVGETFADKNKSTNYWNKLFDGQGATNAIKEKIYTEQMVRLLTLRAIALPETLVNLLKWLKIGAKNSEYGNLSLEFQGQIRNLLYEDDLKAQIMVGGRNLIEEVLTEDITVKATAIFLSDVKSIWAKYRLEYAKDLKNDLEILGEQQATYRQSQTTFNYSFSKGMQRYWQPYRVKPNSDYYVLAELFNELKDYQLAACFHQLSYSYVPSDLFTKAFPKYYGLISFNGLRIRQEGYNFRGEKIIVPRLYVAIVAVISLLLGGLGGVVGTSIYNQNNSSGKETISTDEKANLEAEANKLPIAMEAVNKFSETQTSLTSISQELKTKCAGKKTDQEIQTAIKGTLNQTDLQFAANKDQTIEIGKWVQTILKYQKTKNTVSPQDGIITKDAATYKKLVEEAQQKLKCSG